MTEKKVLIIEDSNLVRLEVKRILETYGLTVLELNNAEDFFRFSDRYTDLSLLILDITLPGMDGLTALEKIHSQQKFAYLPVIMLTGRADRDTVCRALQAGAVNYIRKPFGREELVERVEHVLGPLVPPPVAENERMEPSFETQIRLEVNRAKRGGNHFSLLQVKVPAEMRSLSRLPDLVSMRNRIKDLLRDIDLVFITKDRDLLVILPLTTAEGAKVVTEKLREQIDPTEKQAVRFATVTFPEDGDNEQDLLAALKQKSSS